MMLKEPKKKAKKVRGSKKERKSLISGGHGLKRGGEEIGSLPYRNLLKEE